AYLIAGIFSAAMCSESSALNSLASALSLDIVAPLLGKKHVEGRRVLVLGKLLTLFWTIVLAGLAVGFSRLPQNVPAVQVALGLASVTAGGLLGAFLVAALGRAAFSARSCSRSGRGKRVRRTRLPRSGRRRSSCCSFGSAPRVGCRSRSAGRSRGRGIRCSARRSRSLWVGSSHSATPWRTRGSHSEHDATFRALL